MEPAYLRIAAASERSGLSRSRIYLLMASGEIRARKDGSTTLIEWRSVLDYLAALPPATFGAARRIAA